MLASILWAGAGCQHGASDGVVSAPASSGRRTLPAGAGASATAAGSSSAAGAASAGSAGAGRRSAVASAAAAASAGTLKPPLPAHSWAGKPPFRSDSKVDVLISGGSVIDGSGAAPAVADVVIDGGHIVHIGRVDAGVEAKRRIDAGGKVVTPGFVDMHSPADPLNANQNLLSMGVTTAVVGQDGRSPSNSHMRSWMNRLSGKRLAVNIAALVGHSTVRGFAGLGASRDLSEQQIASMAGIVAKELDAGAFGLSSGLEYQPGALASRDELIGIAKPVAARDGVIMSHLRSEDDDAIDLALDELLAQSSEGGARVHVAHIKVVYGKGAARAERLLQKLTRARAGGVDVTADIYPYNASYTTINIVFPPWAKPPASFSRAKRERRAELEAFLRDKIKRRGGPEATLFGSTPYTGRTLAQVAERKGKPFEDVLIDDIRPGGASAAYFVMDDALQSRLLQDERVMFSTDGGPYSSHPRGYGSFARVLAEHVRTRRALPLHEAVRKMTGLSAKTLRLDKLKRGLLKPGFWADVLVFDLANIRDRASYEKPHRLSVGMQWVFVNGRAVIEDGKLNTKRYGQLLKPAELAR